MTRGLDPRNDDHVYNGILKEFIGEGIVPEKYKVLVDIRRNNGDLLPYKELVGDFADLLNELYKGMDDSLQFHPNGSNTEAKDGKQAGKPAGEAAGSAPAAAKAPSDNDSAAPDVKKDFRGVACPMNFVKTKIALAPMKSGQLLEILLDDGQPIPHVPGSVRNEGHTVLSTEKVDNYWKVLIRKK